MKKQPIEPVIIVHPDTLREAQELGLAPKPKQPRLPRIARLVAAGNPLALAVAQGPAIHNRATRRSVGLFGWLWRWDTNVEGMRRTFVPRYIRRHYAVATMLAPKTRRQRKERARMMRLTKAHGLA